MIASAFAATARAELTSAITEYGITWTFDKPYESGRFINGDYWVTGPVRIIAIEPPCVKEDNHIYNGSQINPSPCDGVTQGFDNWAGVVRQGYSAADYETIRKIGIEEFRKQRKENPQQKEKIDADKNPHYDPKLNVAYGISKDKPLLVPPGSSLVSFVCNKEFKLVGELVHPEIAAVLTVLHKPAPEGSFRPSYADKDKTLYNWNQIKKERLALLRNLEMPEFPPKPGEGTNAANRVNSWMGGAYGPPPVEEVAGWFQKPWYTVMPEPKGSCARPLQNMMFYGRDIAAQVSIAGLMLHLNYPEEQKKKLLINMIQVGIDLYGVAKDAAHSEKYNPANPDFSGHATIFGVGGGVWDGFRFPIVLAGIMLDEPAILNAKYHDNENGQTYYGNCWTGAKVCWGQHWSWRNHAGFTKAARKDEFYEQYPPSEWTVDGGGRPGDPKMGNNSGLRHETYRRNNNSRQWVGEALSMRLMGGEKFWNHDPFFDYVDRWMYEDDTEFLKALIAATDAIDRLHYGQSAKRSFCQRTSGNLFVDKMWAKYRTMPDLPPTDGWKKDHPGAAENAYREEEVK